jgi:NTE family protein
VRLPTLRRFIIQIRDIMGYAYAHTKSALARELWGGQFDPLSGVILHEAGEFSALAAG